MNRALPWLLLVLSLSHTESALAYCGATTCGALPGDECAVDALGCPTDGAPLAWPLGSTVSVVCANCDELIAEALNGAAQSWQEVTCEGISANVTLVLASELSDQKQDAIVVEVIEEGWPCGHMAVGHTTIDFGITTGTIVRTTIGLNAEDFLLGTATEGVETDVQAVLTHELGHALGLAHSAVSGATMQAEAEVGYVSELSTLGEDDEQGLCALYPPEPDDAGAGGEGGPSPNEKGGGGCSIAGPGAQMGAGATRGAGWSGVLLLFALGRRRVSSTLRPAA